MRRYSIDFIQKIKELRKKEKLTFRELERKVGIPASTIRNWCDDVVGTRWDKILLANEKKREEIRNSENEIVPSCKSFSKTEAKFLAGILYGCEGSKYPASKGVSFANSEPKLILAFLRILRTAFDLDEKRIRLHLQTHTTQDYEKLKDFWSKLLNLPKTCFIKPTLTKPKGSKHRNNYLGTCTLRYGDYNIQLKLLGIFKKFINSF